MASFLTENNHFNSKAGYLAPGPAVTPTSPPPTNTTRILRNTRDQSFRRALLKRKKDYDAAKKDSRLGRHQKLDFHRDALCTQKEEIALVRGYGLSNKQQRDLYSELGYTGIRRFLEQPDTTIYALSTVGSKDEGPVGSPESEIEEPTLQLSPGLETELEGLGNVMVELEETVASEPVS